MREDSEFALSPEEAHHVQNVLRAKPGDVIEVVDDTRALFSAEVKSGSRAVILDRLQEPGKDVLEVNLYQAVPKGRHMDLVVEKAAEIGAARIVPLVTRQSVVRPDRGSAKIERWRKLAHSAARQSLQLRVPDVDEPVTFKEALHGVLENAVLLHNDRELPPLEEVLAGPPVDLFVGPEGGWSKEEVDLATENGFSLAQLGPYRLRSETAGIVAVARTLAKLQRSLD